MKQILIRPHGFEDEIEGTYTVDGATSNEYKVYLPSINGNGTVIIDSCGITLWLANGYNIRFTADEASLIGAATRLAKDFSIDFQVASNSFKEALQCLGITITIHQNAGNEIVEGDYP